MDVRAVSRAGVNGNDSLPSGALTWAIVQDINNKHTSNLRAVGLFGDHLYTSGRKGIRRIDARDGR